MSTLTQTHLRDRRQPSVSRSQCGKTRSADQLAGSTARIDALGFRRRFGKFDLAGEVGIMGRKPIGVFPGFGQVERVALLDSELRQRRGSTEPLPLRCDEL